MSKVQNAEALPPGTRVGFRRGDEIIWAEVPEREDRDHYLEGRGWTYPLDEIVVATWGSRLGGPLNWIHISKAIVAGTTCAECDGIITSADDYLCRDCRTKLSAQTQRD